MKRFINWIKTQITWFMSRDVLNAINSGASYEEVVAVVNAEVER